MTPERWHRIESLVEAALKRQAADRPAFLDAACGEDSNSRAEVEALLASYEESETFLEQPAIEQFEAGPSTPSTDHRAESPQSIVSAEAEKVGPYRLLRPLGRGGMGAVYLAVRDDEYRRRVALKVLPAGPVSDDILRRFKSERQILASLDHPNIAKLFDGGNTADGRPFIVMELVEGTPIDLYCDQKRLTVKERLELFHEVCSAVQYAHQNLVVHRDLKPGNILVTEDGTPKLLDFGIAKLLNPEMFPHTVEATKTDFRLMTPSYASPEQLRGQPITTSSDVYSLGMLLFRLLTGRMPYQITSLHPQAVEKVLRTREPTRPSTAVTRRGEDVVEGSVPERVGRDRSTSPRHLERLLRGDLDNIVLMALRQEPQRRYGTVEQFGADIRRHLRGLPVRARADTLGYRAWKFLARNKVPVTAVAGLFILLLGFAATVTFQAREIAKERDRAEHERARAQRVSGFMVGLFAEVNSDEGQGKDVTVREVMDQGVDRIQQQLSDQPELQASLLAVMGRVYLNLGLHPQAEPLLTEALQIFQELPGRELETAEALVDLATYSLAIGNYQQAGELLPRALTLQEEMLGSRDAALTETLFLLGRFWFSKGEYEEARALYQRVEGILKLTQEPDPGDQAQLYEFMAFERLMSGDQEKALSFLEKASEFVPQLPPTLIVAHLHNAGTLYLEIEDFDRAAETLERALELEEEIYDPTYPNCAN